jgi:hypothetical protein
MHTKYIGTSLKYNITIGDENFYTTIHACLDIFLALFE